MKWGERGRGQEERITGKGCGEEKIGEEEGKRGKGKKS